MTEQSTKTNPANKRIKKEKKDGPKDVHPENSAKINNQNNQTRNLRKTP